MCNREKRQEKNMRSQTQCALCIRRESAAHTQRIINIRKPERFAKFGFAKQSKSRRVILIEDVCTRETIHIFDLASFASAFALRGLWLVFSETYRGCASDVGVGKMDSIKIMTHEFQPRGGNSYLHPTLASPTTISHLQNTTPKIRDDPESHEGNMGWKEHKFSDRWPHA